MHLSLCLSLSLPLACTLALTLSPALSLSLSLSQGFVEDYTLSIQNGEEQSDVEDDRASDGDSVRFVTLLEVCTFSKVASSGTLHSQK